MKRLRADRTVLSLAFSPDGRLLAAGGWRHLSLWDTRTGAETPVDQDPCLLVPSAAFTPDGRTLAWMAVAPGVERTEAQLRLGRVAEARAAENIRQGGSGDLGVACLADGRVLAVSAGRPSCWDPETCRRLHWPDTPAGTSVALWETPTGRVPVAVSRDRQPIDLFDRVPDGAYLARLAGPVAEVWQAGPLRQVFRQAVGHYLALAFTPDGRFLLAGRPDGTLAVWETDGWSPRDRLDWAIGCAECLAISPDGLTAAASGYGGEIVIWDLDL